MSNDIELPHGLVAIVDEEDFERVNQLKWYVSKGYAIRMERRTPGKRPITRMHRFVLGMTASDPEQVDHINGNRLDNRKSNLRKCTNSQNQCNRSATSTGRSGLKGVSFHKDTKKWQAQIKINGKGKYLGLFDNPESAHEAYCRAVHELHGEFSRID